jgi:tRNA pseudouridine38-40 synthase
MTDNPKSPTDNPQSIQRVALVIQYLGTNFHGWQRQPNQRTVQEEIETAISTVLERPVTLHAAGENGCGSSRRCSSSPF